MAKDGKEVPSCAEWTQDEVSQINDDFNRFLHISQADSDLLKCHQPLLLRGGERFAEAFYDYLFRFPATAQVLEDYQAQGGKIENLVSKQLFHLQSFLSGSYDAESATELTRIGRIHQQHGIKPVWFMGAYRLYLDYLHDVIAANTTLPGEERERLEDAIQKFLFRDMGMMFEGYWEAALSEIQAEKSKAAQLQEQITGLLGNIPQILWSVDVRNNTPLYISPSTRKICSVDMEMPIPCLAWTHPDDRELVKTAWREALQGKRVDVESRVQEPGQESRWFRRVFHPYADETGAVVRIDGLMDETTKWKEVITRLHVLATTDSLTGLPNRSLLYDRLTQTIAAARRDGGTQVALMLMDLDHFKEINDTLGHPAGDEVLRQVAARLTPLLRDSDTLARLGGDEFAVILPDVANGLEAAHMVAETIAGAFSLPFFYEGRDLYLGVGIGIALYPDHGEDVDTLMSRADLAMYGSKHKGIGSVVYQHKANDSSEHRLQLASELRRALERDEFVLHYQPKIELKSGLAYGVEALIRWQHPELGLILPDQFISFAERSGLIQPITDWLIETLAIQCRRWEEDGSNLSVALNVSASSFQNPKLLQRLHDTLTTGPMLGRASQLEIEITENTLMADIEHGSHVLRQLRELGVTVAIDDFGTGYSSLSYLKQLPIQSIKIDKSFVINMAQDASDAAIVRSTIELAHNLGYEVVAEGVESGDTLSLLTHMGCDNAQGYFMGRPVPIEQIPLWLAESPWSPSRH